LPPLVVSNGKTRRGPKMASVNYNRVAWIYEALGYIYSGRQIYAAKVSQVAEMRPRDKVLYVGVGPGDDALLAARHKAEVTCIDLAPGMLRQAAARMSRERLRAEFICGDVMQHQRVGYYDVVVVNFFLNVFSEPAMRQMLAYLATLARPGGKLLISDFMAPQGNVASRFAQSVYWGVTNLFYYLLSLSAWHPIYDYPQYFDGADLEFQAIKRFRPLKISPVGFSAITATRKAA
jgi:ubiquinone/menaquinone biosynthesis C-methylase UbiE